MNPDTTARPQALEADLAANLHRLAALRDRRGALLREHPDLARWIMDRAPEPRADVLEVYRALQSERDALLGEGVRLELEMARLLGPSGAEPPDPADPTATLAFLAPALHARWGEWNAAGPEGTLRPERFASEWRRDDEQVRAMTGGRAP